MSQYVEGRYRTFEAGGAIPQFARVKLGTGVQVVVSDDDADTIGVAYRKADASGDEISVALKNAQGTHIMIASAAITAGATVNAAAGGKVAPTGTNTIGKALSAASGDNAQLEVLIT